MGYYALVEATSTTEMPYLRPTLYTRYDLALVAANLRRAEVEWNWRTGQGSVRPLAFTLAIVEVSFQPTSFRANATRVPTRNV